MLREISGVLMIFSVSIGVHGIEDAKRPFFPGTSGYGGKLLLVAHKDVDVVRRTMRQQNDVALLGPQDAMQDVARRVDPPGPESEGLFPILPSA